MGRGVSRACQEGPLGRDRLAGHPEPCGWAASGRAGERASAREGSPRDGPGRPASAAPGPPQLTSNAAAGRFQCRRQGRAGGWRGFLPPQVWGPDPRGPSRRCDVQRPQAWACGCVTRSLPPSSRGFSDPLRLPLRDTVPRFRPPQARGNGLISRPSPSSCPGALFQTRSCHRLWGLGLQSFGGRFSTNHDCH